MMNKDEIMSKCLGLALELEKDYDPNKKTITIKGVDYFEPVEGVYVWIKDALTQTKCIFEIEEDMEMESKFYMVDKYEDAYTISFERFSLIVEKTCINHMEK